MHRKRNCLLFLSVCVALAASLVATAQGYTVNLPMDQATYRPMDGMARWNRWWSETGGSPSIYTNSLIVASVTQGVNTPPQWGRNLGGFGRRVGSESGNFFIANTVHEGMAGAMQTDTRYFPCACTGLFRRSGHALKMTFLTYNRNGHQVLDLPQLSGEYGGAMISTMLWPRHYSPLVQGVQTGHLGIGFITVIHQVQEFAPELRQFFHVRAKPTVDTP